jgi:hypothetical protein
MTPTFFKWLFGVMYFLLVVVVQGDMYQGERKNNRKGNLKKDANFVDH